jgi:transcriptional regulator with XRE-family HTH domain
MRDMRPDRQQVLHDFAVYIAAAARAAGYDIDAVRGGGKAALARDTGMPPSSVTRMLKGETLPDPQFYEALAHAVHVPVRELLVRAGILSSALTDTTESPRVASAPTTPEDAADQLGITDPVDREMFLAMIDRLRRSPREGSAGDEPGDAAVGR